MSFLEIAGLILTAATAGAMNAIAGGGTLLTFPVLLLSGVSPMTANATSTVALLVGTSGSIFGFRKNLAAVRPWLVRFTPVSIAGGLAGSALVTRGGEQLFARLVPYLVLFATVIFVSQSAVARWVRRSSNSRPQSPAHGTSLSLALVFQFAVAVYGGYFGAGIGILMLATLGALGMTDIHEMNTVKTVLGSFINVVAALWFINAHLVDWPRAALMMIGAVSGYYLGAHFSQKIPQNRVRQLIATIGFALGGVLLLKQWK